MRKSAELQHARSNTWARARVLTPLLQNRVFSGWIAAAGILHLALADFSHPNLGCTLQTLTGVRCPGCGLTTAMLELLHGKWAEAGSHHAFAPVFFLALVLITVAAVLPERWRLNLVAAVGRFEQSTAVAPLIGCGLLGYWWIRL